MNLSGAVANRDSWSAERCSLDRAFAIIGTRSAVLLLREAYYGATRFDDFVSRTGITEASAAARLKDLVEVGLLKRQPYQEPGQRARSEYVLTDAGVELLPAILGLFNWGDAHLAGHDGGPPLALLHQNCGAAVTATVRCADGHDVGLSEIEVRARRPKASRETARASQAGAASKAKGATMRATAT
jgi:DNA-binding HxlR family transcriptional regulator